MVKVIEDGIVQQQITKAKTPTIYNVTMINLDTEYSQALPTKTKKFLIHLKEEGIAFRLAFETGKVATPTEPYLTIPKDRAYCEDLVEVTDTTLYFACSTAGQHIQIICWT